MNTSFMSDGSSFVGRRPPPYWVNPFTGRTYGRPRISFRGRPTIQQQIAYRKYMRAPTFKNLLTLKNLGAMIVFGAMDLATISQRNKIFGINNKMYGGLYTYKHTPRTSTKKVVVNKSTSTKRRPAKVVKKKFRKYKKTQKANTKALSKQIQTLRRQVHADKAFHTYKLAGSGRVLSNPAQCNHQVYTFNNPSEVQGYMANMRYFNPSAPGTLVTANPSTGTYSHDIQVKDIYSKIVCRNNYQVPVDIKIYLASAKDTTNIDPVTAYGNQDQVINAITPSTTPLLHLTEIETVTDSWNVKCMVNKTLEPGQSCSAVHTTGTYQIDPAFFDSETDAYTKKYKVSVWIVRVQGVIAHDTTVATEQTLINAGVDVDRLIVAKFEYDAGVNLNDIYISDTRDASFTNGGVVSLKPVADNIGYSIS